jgi:uncharacterized membrane protein
MFIVFVFSLLIFANFSIIFNIPFAHQIGGFLLLTFIPGIIFVHIFRLDKVELTTKLLLSIGLSIFFLMIMGISINLLLISLGFDKPLSLINLLIGFDIFIIILLSISYKRNRYISLNFKKFDLNVIEKVFVLIGIILIFLSVYGTYIMQLTNNNIFLLILLIFIPIYVIFATIYGQNIQKIYPIIILLIGISMQLIFMVLFPHISGGDVHIEYYYFKTTLNTLQWDINLMPNSAYDACLSISILPAIYQLFVKIPNQEYFFKGLYVFLFSFAPLIIYNISKRYINEIYSFLASFLFMNQYFFMKTAASPRTNIAVFFVAMLVLVLFDDKIPALQKKLLAIIFLISVVVSHYSTSYIFLIMILFSWIIAKIFISTNKLKFNRNISMVFLILFFTLTFLWYGQVTDNAFTHGIDFLGNTINGLNNFFVNEMREEAISKLAGIGLENPFISGFNLFLTWSIFILMGMGVLISFVNYKENLKLINNKKINSFLKKRIDVEFGTLSLISILVLTMTIVIPFVSKGYDFQRIYMLTTIFLSFYFVFGTLNLMKLLKLRFKPHIIILLILVPYSLFTTGVLYEITGYNSDVTLNSDVITFDNIYITDAEVKNALWLSRSIGNKIYTADASAKNLLISQGLISPLKIDDYSISIGKTNINDFIFLSNFDKKYGIFMNNSSLKIEDCSFLSNKNVIYDSGFSLTYF